METLSLWPTPIGIFQYTEIISDEQLKSIVDMERSPNEGNTTSKNNYVLDLPEHNNIKQFVQFCVDTYFTQLYCPEKDIRLRLTQTWFNYSEKGQFHHKHAHPNSFLSGVFYIQTSDSDRIYFHKDSWKQLDIPAKEFNVFNSPSWWYPVTQYSCLVFPSSTGHHVPPVENEKTRISLAFNTFPVGYIGDDKTLTGLHL
jgi:uncharacterized protein (TIGR02466 family)